MSTLPAPEDPGWTSGIWVRYKHPCCGELFEMGNMKSDNVLLLEHHNGLGSDWCVRLAQVLDRAVEAARKKHVCKMR